MTFLQERFPLKGSKCLIDDFNSLLIIIIALELYNLTDVFTKFNFTPVQTCHVCR